MTAQVVGGPHTNFPVLISLTLADLKTVANGGDVQNASGFDIIFTSDQAGSTQLAHQIERYDGSTGEIVMWVRSPSLASSTKIYLFYGNSSISSFQGDVTSNGVTGVWDNEYQGVWHLNEAIDATNIDATTNTNDGTPLNSPAAAVGKMAGALDFDVNGTTTAVAIPADPTLDLSTYPSWTISAWVKPATYVGTKWPLVYGYGVYNASLGLSQVNSPDGLVEHWLNDGNLLQSSAATTIGAWSHIAVVRDADTTRLYLNGVEDGSRPSVAISNAGQASWIGSDGFASDDFLGVIDEARVSNTVRSAGWFATEYNNQDSPSTLEFKFEVQRARAS